MPCIYGDQPLRVRLTKNGVVHAASYQEFGGFSRYNSKTGEHTQVPKRKYISVVCRRWKWAEEPKDLKSKLISNKEKITCKSCQERMGLTDKPLSPKRFVVRRKSDGKFLKNTNTRCTSWSDSVTDAFFFKREHTAASKCKTGRYKVGTRFLTYSEWQAAGRPNREYVRIYDPDLEVKTVKITLE